MAPTKLFDYAKAPIFLLHVLSDYFSRECCASLKYNCRTHCWIELKWHWFQFSCLRITTLNVDVISFVFFIIILPNRKCRFITKMAHYTIIVSKRCFNNITNQFFICVPDIDFFSRIQWKTKQKQRNTNTNTWFIVQMNCTGSISIVVLIWLLMHHSNYRPYTIRNYSAVSGH